MYLLCLKYLKSESTCLFLLYNSFISFFIHLFFQLYWIFWYICLSVCICLLYCYLSLRSVCYTFLFIHLFFIHPSLYYFIHQFFINSFINSLILSFYRYQITSETSELTNSSIKVITSPDIPKWYSLYFIYIMGAFHFILSVWMLIEYFVHEKPNILLRLPLLSNTL